ncbi:hypothetical protein [Dyadobacter sp. NIV53]|uniref:hypothetical protein n=1 Tax=Dyadobacter sp. NIV53 TaxID=2861765 RepID=UPI001C888412|nr:hypothetical protein [Dyadobacter sp. NIV53]
MNTRSILLNLLLAAVPALAFAQTPLPQKTGGDKDKHGCIGSAGYVFSTIKNDCVRLFEQEIRLKETNPKGTFTSEAVVIFSKNRKKAELFMPGSASSLILTRTGKEGGYVWKKGNLSFFMWKGYVLKRGKKVIFAGA